MSLWMFYYWCIFSTLFKIKEIPQDQKETQTRDRVSRCLSHFGLDSLGKQDFTKHPDDNLWDAREIWDFIRELLSSCRISPYSPSQSKALGLNPRAAVWQERGSPSQGPDCTHRGNITPTTVGLHNPRQKKRSFIVQTTANATLSSLKIKIFALNCWHRIKDPRTKRNTFQYILQAPGFSFYYCFCHHTCLIDVVFTAKSAFKVSGPGRGVRGEVFSFIFCKCY